MSKIELFLSMLCGTFDNTEQFNKMQANGIKDYPFAQHTNSVCNDKITGLPESFQGAFVLEESYYTVNGAMNKMPHLFLITEEADAIKLLSFEMPEGYTKDNFTFENLNDISYQDLKQSEKFTPILYTWNGTSFYGKSVSMFSPVLRFTLEETFSEELLLVSETFEVNGKRTFGYDNPIEYRRCK